MSRASRSTSAAAFVAGFSFAFIVSALCCPAFALWPGDPAINLPIAERSGWETDPIPAATSDGGCYVGWFDPTSGNYCAYLQRLDPLGNEQWPHNGILISNHPQNSALFGWDLAVDADDNAIFVFSDERAGAGLNVYAYKISPAGEFLWGPDGVALSIVAGDEMSPGVTVAGDGDVVVAWSWFPYSGDGAIYMQRLSPAGVPRYPAGGLRIAGNPGESPSFPCLAPSLDGGVIVCWVRDISMYMSPRHLYVQRFAPDGTAIWPSVVSMYDQTAVPLGFRPAIISDGEGGLVSTWNASETSLHTVRVQHLDALGTEIFGHNGVKPTLDATRNHIAPTVSYHPATGECFVFWDERNPGQTSWGLWGQRLSATGARLWGDQGLMYLPLSTVYKTMYRSTPCADGAMVIWLEAPSGSSTADVVRAMRVDAAGAAVWAEPIKTIASLVSDKGRLSMISTPSEMAIATWEDDRGGSFDVYGQNLNPDGTIGVDPAAVAIGGTPGVMPGSTPGDTPGGAGPVGFEAAAQGNIRLSSAPSPFTLQTVIRMITTAPVVAADLVICDAGGRVVRRLGLGDLGPGESQAIWDGRDAAGHRVAGGMYLYVLTHRGRPLARGTTVVLR